MTERQQHRADTSTRDDAESDRQCSDGTVAPTDTARRIQRRAAEIERRELREGRRRFEAGGPTTDEQREILHDLADDLVAALLSAPTETLADTDDPEALATAIELFDPGG